jgi:uncharacterized protein YgiB involved in biofilm formation
MKSSRKRSVAMSLVLIGASTVGCSLEAERTAQRDVYENFADCKSDWGVDDDNCEVFVDQSTQNANGTTTTPGVYGNRLRYYGPLYQPGYRPATVNTRNGSHTVGSKASERHTVSSSRNVGSSASGGGRVSRGGFGSSASSRGSSS